MDALIPASVPWDAPQPANSAQPRNGRTGQAPRERPAGALSFTRPRYRSWGNEHTGSGERRSTRVGACLKMHHSRSRPSLPKPLRAEFRIDFQPMKMQPHNRPAPAARGPVDLGGESSRRPVCETARDANQYAYPAPAPTPPQNRNGSARFSRSAPPKTPARTLCAAHVTAPVLTWGLGAADPQVEGRCAKASRHLRGQPSLSVVPESRRSTTRLP